MTFRYPTENGQKFSKNVWRIELRILNVVSIGLKLAPTSQRWCCTAREVTVSLASQLWPSDRASQTRPWKGRCRDVCSPRGICLGSRHPRGSFFSWLGLASASHGLASVLTLLPRPRLCLIVFASVLARSGR